MPKRFWWTAGAVFGGLAVAAGAFGAHGLKQILTESGMLTTYQTAVEYQMYHALALLALGIAASTTRPRAVAIAGWSFVAGIVLFSGSLYALALSGIKALGMITPIGGIAFLAGWVALACVSLDRSKPSAEP